MSITIETAEFSALTAQPFGYNEGDTQKGLTAKKWAITGPLDPAEWLALLDVYDAWRDARIEDEDSLQSLSIGTTVSLSGTGPGGQTWQTECWFISAPTGEQVGAKILASIEVVDANEALQILIKEQENATQSDENSRPDLGTVTVGTVIVTLLKPMETYGEGPQLQLTASGKYFLSGPFTIRRIRDIEGVIDAQDIATLRTWYESQIVSMPSTGSWYPISSPSFSAEAKVVAGVKTTEYTVTIQLAEII